MSNFDVNASIQAQREYCEQNKAPHFAPNSGVCWKCRKNIYEPVEQKRTLYWEHGQPEETYITGITVEKASSELVTGCPHCHRSYCD